MNSLQTLSLLGIHFILAKYPNEENFSCCICLVLDVDCIYFSGFTEKNKARLDLERGGGDSVV